MLASSALVCGGLGQVQAGPGVLAADAGAGVGRALRGEHPPILGGYSWAQPGKRARWGTGPRLCLPTAKQEGQQVALLRGVPVRPRCRPAACSMKPSTCRPETCSVRAGEGHVAPSCV